MQGSCTPQALRARLGPADCSATCTRQQRRPMTGAGAHNEYRRAGTRQTEEVDVVAPPGANLGGPSRRSVASGRTDVIAQDRSHFVSEEDSRRQARLQL